MVLPYVSFQREDFKNLGDHLKILFFYLIFLGILEFYGGFWRKLDYKDT